MSENLFRDTAEPHLFKSATTVGAHASPCLPSPHRPARGRDAASRPRASHPRRRAGLLGVLRPRLAVSVETDAEVAEAAQIARQRFQSGTVARASESRRLLERDPDNGDHAPDRDRPLELKADLPPRMQPERREDLSTVRGDVEDRCLLAIDPSLEAARNLNAEISPGSQVVGWQRMPRHHKAQWVTRDTLVVGDGQEAQRTEWPVLVPG